jgi:hypothetical protein
MLTDTEYDSDDSYVDGINSFINMYSSNENSRNTSRNNSYKSNTGEILMMTNFNLKKKEALKLLNEELEYKLYLSKNMYYVYIYKQVLKELHRYFNEIRFFKILYNIVMKEFKNRDIYWFGKSYMRFVASL